MGTSQTNREIEFTSIPENVNLVESFLENVKSEIGMSDEMEANVLVSLSEAANNAIYHGNKLDASKKVRMNMQKEDKSLVFSVEDEGPGFDFTNVKDPTAPENLDKPTGRGVFLMRNLADKVEFAEGGRKVVITFNLP